MLYSYSIGFFYILTGLFCVGGLGPAVAFCSEVNILFDDMSAWVCILCVLSILLEISECINTCENKCAFWSFPIKRVVLRFFFFNILLLAYRKLVDSFFVHSSFLIYYLPASCEDIRLCLLLLSYGLFWNLLRASLNQALRCPCCSDRSETQEKIFFLFAFNFLQR